MSSLSARRLRRRPAHAYAVGVFQRSAASLVDLLIPTAIFVGLYLAQLVPTWTVPDESNIFFIDLLLREITSRPWDFLSVFVSWMGVWTICMTAAYVGVKVTPGKALLGLRVRQANGQLSSTSRLLARVVACWLVPASLGLAYLWIIVSPTKQGWHDTFSGTYIVRDTSAPPGYQVGDVHGDGGKEQRSTDSKDSERPVRKVFLP